MVSRLHMDCAVNMASHLGSYSLSQLTRVSRFWTALNGDRQLWSRLLRRASPEVDARLRRLAPRFLRAGPGRRTDRHAVASAYACCRFMVRALRDEYTHHHSILNDAVRIFGAHVQSDEPPYVMGSLADRARVAWDDFQSTITRIPLCTRWDAVAMARLLWTDVRVMARVMGYVRNDALCCARLCSARVSARKSYAHYEREVGRIVRRFDFVVRNGKIAMSILSGDA